MEKTKDTVTDVHFYPIKSCGPATINGRPPERLEVGEFGFEYRVEKPRQDASSKEAGDSDSTETALAVGDRDYMLVDSSGYFVSQRGWNKVHDVATPEDSRLTTVSIDIREDEMCLSSLGDVDKYMSFPLRVQPEEESRVYGMGDHSIWGYDEGEPAAVFFSNVVGRPVRLIRINRAAARALPPEYQRQGASNRVTGADGMQFTLASNASLDELHDRRGWHRNIVPMDRFRPNIVINGNEIGPFGEDKALQIRIGQFIAFVVKPCDRCEVTDIDQVTGERGDSSATELLRQRSGWLRGSDSLSRPRRYFGQSLNHNFVMPEGTMSVGTGDRLSVNEWAEEPNVVLRYEKRP